MDWTIREMKKGLKGEITVPPDKSISHRAIMFSCLCSGKTRISNFLFAEDCMRTVEAFREMGCSVSVSGKDIIVEGRGLHGLEAPRGELYLGNSGTTMRIISGIIAGAGIPAVLAGDSSLSKRPMGRVTVPLREMGAIVETSEGDLPPLCFRQRNSPFKAIDHISPVASAQVKSCVLSAGLYADGTTSVTEPFKSRDHTERMLKYFGADIKEEGLTLSVTGRKELAPADIRVPGDISSAAFFIVAALIVDGSEVLLRDVGINPTRKGILDVLERMGAEIEIVEKPHKQEPEADLIVKYSSLKGTVVENSEIPFLIDEIPVLAVAALHAEGETRIHGIRELKVKESDRAACMASNLKKMGCEITEQGDTLIVPGSGAEMKGASFESFGDHRIAMSMAIAALKAKGESRIQGAECADTSYPGFLKDLKTLYAPGA